MFTGDADRHADGDVDLDAARRHERSPGVSGFVGETAQGGPATTAATRSTPTGNHAPVVTAPADRTHARCARRSR